MTILIYILIWIVCYIIGSLSPAVFLSKTFAGYDIRTKGSMNAGSTNVFRVMGAKFGFLNFFLDMLKGFLPTFLALKLAGDTVLAPQVAGAIAASGVILGHALPVFSKFKGGKCVASMTGVLAAFNPIITIIVTLLAFVSIGITRYVSAASITIFFIYPIIAWFMPGDTYSLPFKILLTCGGALILYLHRQNIVRLFKGEENPLFGPKKKKKEADTAD